MNDWQQMWDVRGYGQRRARIFACSASHNRKLVACMRVWCRMKTQG